MSSQLRKQTILMHMLPNISRITGSKTMKSGQCYMRHIFHEKSYPKYGGETIPRPFSKNLKLSISLDQ